MDGTGRPRGSEADGAAAPRSAGADGNPPSGDEAREQTSDEVAEGIEERPKKKRRLRISLGFLGGRRKPEKARAGDASVEAVNVEDAADDQGTGSTDGPGEAKGPSSASHGPLLRIQEPRDPVGPGGAPRGRARRGPYALPSVSLLDEPERVGSREQERVIREQASVLEAALRNFKIDAEVVEIERGPVVTLFELELSAGTKVQRVIGLEDDLAIALKASSVRVVAPLPGKSTIGIEVPNPLRESVRLKDLISHESLKKNLNALPLYLGKNLSGKPLTEDLAAMPHLLIAGSTGSGKSVCLNTIILSFLMSRTPEEIRVILIDPKMVELSQFREIPHLLCPVVTDMRRVPAILDWAVNKMEERYSLLAEAQVRNIQGYNKLGEEELRRRVGEEAIDKGEVPLELPFLVLVVDELADLMMVARKEVENSIVRLAQKSRAVGIHLILATQRPSIDVITGLIKANMPTRIAFRVASKIDSRVVLDQNGAEKLLGQGDMLVLPPRSSDLVRSQGTFVSDEEIRRVTDYLKGAAASPEFSTDLVRSGSEAGSVEDRDELYDDAVRIIVESQRGSASLLQRALEIGYTRASRLMDLMAQDGVVGEFKGSKAREVLITCDEWEARVAARKAKGEAGGEPEPAAAGTKGTGDGEEA